MMQAAGRPKRYHKNTDSISKSNNKDKPIVTDNENSKLNYFLPGPNKDNDKKWSAEITQQLQRDFKDAFIRIGYTDGTFSFWVKPDNKLYQVPLRCMVYALQRPFK